MTTTTKPQQTIRRLRRPSAVRIRVIRSTAVLAAILLSVTAVDGLASGFVRSSRSHTANPDRAADRRDRYTGASRESIEQRAAYLRERLRRSASDRSRRASVADDAMARRPIDRPRSLR
jgi:hypothetical protein